MNGKLLLNSIIVSFSKIMVTGILTLHNLTYTHTAKYNEDKGNEMRKVIMVIGESAIVYSITNFFSLFSIALFDMCVASYISRACKECEVVSSVIR